MMYASYLLICHCLQIIDAWLFIYCIYIHISFQQFSWIHVFALDFLVFLLSRQVCCVSPVCKAHALLVFEIMEVKF